MASMNKVILIGNLGNDPEVRVTSNNQTVCTFNIATTEKWAGKAGGQPGEKTEWHRIVVWGKMAEVCKEYLAKGRQVLIEGRIQTRQWEDKEGHKRSTTEVVAQNVQFLSSPQGRSKGESKEESPTFSPPPSSGAEASVDDDIPF
ncbi:MAG: single-stranded DNA-binding protein [bacterium]|nr:single-stranded DNA-binding protein [bacterium]